MSKVLLVEDNKLSQKMMYYTMKRLGVIADLAENGVEAVAMAKVKNYDLILMDVMMPELDGYESTKKIREIEKSTGHHAFIIGLTSYVYDQEREKCLNAGMDEYLSKPFDIDRFRSIVEPLNIISFE